MAQTSLTVDEPVLERVQKMKQRLVADGMMAALPDDLVPARFREDGRLTNGDLVLLGLHALERMLGDIERRASARRGRR